MDIWRLTFFVEIMVKLWKTWTRYSVPKWVLIFCPKILQMPQKISDENVCPSPKVWDFWKRFSLGVCSPWLQASIFSKVSQVCRILFRSKISKFKIIIQWLMSVTSWSFLLEPLYFLKLGPIFVGSTLCQFTKYSNFIFELKTCFFGPIRQETPWRNWH